MSATTRSLALVVLLGAVLRLAYAVEMVELPTARHPVMDALRYDLLAREIAAGKWLPDEPFYQAPLYPYTLATFYAFLSPSRLPPRLFQVILASLTIAVVALATHRLFGPRAAFFAALLTALYGPFVFYTPRLVKSTMHLFVFALFLHRVVMTWDRGDRSDFLFAGFLLGLTALFRENLLLVGFFFLVWVLCPLPRERPALFPDRLRHAALFCCGVLLALAPVAALNLSSGGEVVLVSTNSGVNFYVGNSPGASGTFAPLSGRSQDPETQEADARQLAAAIESSRLGTVVDPGTLGAGETSRIFWREGLTSIASDPGSWVRLMARKTLLFWQGYEIPDAEDFYVYRRLAPSLLLAPLSFVLVAPLGLVGLLGLLRQRAGLSFLLLALVTGVFFSVVLFFVFGRFRLSIVILLIPPAAWLLDRMLEALKHRDMGSAGGWLAAILATTAILNVSHDATAQRFLEGSTYYNLAAASLLEAEEKYQEYLGSRSPAVLSSAQAETLSALGFLDEALDRDPAWTTAHLQRSSALHRLGIYQYHQGELEEALGLFQTALEALPPPSLQDPDVRHKAEALEESIEDSLTLSVVNRGAELLAAGHLLEARELLARGADLRPESFEAHLNLGICLLREAETAGTVTDQEMALTQARAALERAVSRAGDQASEGRARALLEIAQAMDLGT